MRDGNLAGDGVVHALFAPAARDIVSLFDLGKQRGNVLGGVLQVAVERNDDVALCFVEAGGKRGGLPEIAAQADHFQTAVGFHQIGQQIEAAIGGRVIHNDNFVRLLHGLQHRRQTVVERQNGRLLIVNGDDD